MAPQVLCREAAMNLKYLARGAAAADRMRRRLATTGETMNGQPLWTQKEIETLKRLYPLMGYAKIAKRLKRRSYWAVRCKAQELGLTKKRHVWTGPEVAKLRRVFTRGSPADIRAAFPQFSYTHLARTASNHGIIRGRQPFKETGIPVVDQIRSRAFELGYSMPDIDELAHTKRYFQAASWHGGHVNHKAIARAVAALDGELRAEWRE